MRFDEINEDKEQRKQNALWAQITAHEKAAKKSKDIKRDHHLKMADQLRSQLKTIDEGFDYTAKDLGNDYAGFPSNHSMKHKFLAKIKPEKQQLYKDKMNNTHDWESLFALFKVAKARGDIIEQGVAEGEVVAFPKKHRGDISNMHTCPKCGGDTQGGKYQGHEVQVCMPCKQVYLPPNSGIDQQGNKIKEQGVAEEKVRLDPKCWTGKKIGNPKTKMKGGVRVNNCVPAESVAEGLEQGNYNVGLEDIGKPVTVDGESGYVLLSIGYSSGNGKLTAHILQPDTGAKGTYDLETISKGKQGVAEEYNAEYDDEAGMAQGSLHTLQNAVEGLQQVIDDRDNLPEWCQEKISLAEDYLVTVWDYLQSEKAQGVDPELNEEFDLIESIVDRIAAQNGVDAEMVWEDLESLTEDELYAFAVTSQLNEDWQKANKSDRTDGMSRKAVKAYRRANPGSKLQTAVTTKPSKLKKGSKASKRRKSYCSRSKGQMNMHNISCAKTPDKAICKARRRWNC